MRDYKKEPELGEEKNKKAELQAEIGFILVLGLKSKNTNMQIIKIPTENTRDLIEHSYTAVVRLCCCKQ